MTVTDPGPHYHTCRACGFSWSHNPGPMYTQWIVDRLHTCTRCGTVTTSIAGLGYIGQLSATYRPSNQISAKGLAGLGIVTALAVALL